MKRKPVVGETLLERHPRRSSRRLGKGGEVKRVWISVLIFSASITVTWDLQTKTTLVYFYSFLILWLLWEIELMRFNQKNQ